jgi:hypothetical protein
MQAIIYKQDSGVVAIVRPTEEALRSHSIQDIAIKDVPSGKPFAIIDAAGIPADRNQRNAWTVDEADLTDGVGGESSEFPEVSNAD